MSVYEYAGQEAAWNDPKWKVKVVQSRVVVQELEYGETMDELFAGTPSSRRHNAVKGGGRTTVYIGLSRQDPRRGIANPKWPSLVGMPHETPQ